VALRPAFWSVFTLHSFWSWQQLHESDRADAVPSCIGKSLGRLTITPEPSTPTTGLITHSPDTRLQSNGRIILVASLLVVHPVLSLEHCTDCWHRPNYSTWLAEKFLPLDVSLLWAFVPSFQLFGQCYSHSHPCLTNLSACDNVTALKAHQNFYKNKSWPWETFKKLKRDILERRKESSHKVWRKKKEKKKEN
jgi:hypothetical protein